MKVRNGFVSNSSSASFVIVGFNADDVLDNKNLPSEFYDDIDEFDFNTVNSDDDDLPDGINLIVGKFLVYFHDNNYYHPNTEVLDLQGATEKAEQAKAHFGSQNPIKLYAGVMAM